MTNFWLGNNEKEDERRLNVWSNGLTVGEFVKMDREHLARRHLWKTAGDRRKTDIRERPKEDGRNLQ